jgi:hypothetical protein
MSLWQVSQEEARRCLQQRHCKQAGQVVPGIEQSVISQLSSMISPFQGNALLLQAMEIF